jgi:hypothetical protein
MFGEIARVDMPFSNGLQHPGGEGPAGEVINCRCTVAPYYGEEAKPEKKPAAKPKADAPVEEWREFDNIEDAKAWGARNGIDYTSSISDAHRARPGGEVFSEPSYMPSLDTMNEFNRAWATMRSKLRPAEFEVIDAKGGITVSESHIEAFAEVFTADSKYHIVIDRELKSRLDYYSSVIADTPEFRDYADFSTQGIMRHEMGHVLYFTNGSGVGTNVFYKSGLTHGKPLDYYISEYQKANMGEHMAEFLTYITRDGFAVGDLPEYMRPVVEAFLR